MSSACAPCSTFRTSPTGAFHERHDETAGGKAEQLPGDAEDVAARDRARAAEAHERRSHGAHRPHRLPRRTRSSRNATRSPSSPRSSSPRSWGSRSGSWAKRTWSRSTRSRARKCQLIPGYQGLMKLARNSGLIDRHLRPRGARADEFEVTLGLTRSLTHKPLVRNGFPAAKTSAARSPASTASRLFKDGTKTFAAMSAPRGRAHPRQLEGLPAIEEGQEGKPVGHRVHRDGREDGDPAAVQVPAEEPGARDGARARRCGLPRQGAGLERRGGARRHLGAGRGRP
jgi:hypothetical protein